ncbi:MAG: hypothetical protein KGH69_00935 [Candidatus Micrarchaeota archaeon]|nr:hypothetical protein [Candidatus Micrarchaeota archaeon]
MRLQSSLEFLLITGAIGLLMVSVLAAYGSGASNYGKSISYLDGNMTAPAHVNGAQQHEDPRFYAYFPPNATVGYESYGELSLYGCNDGTATIHANSSSALPIDSTLQLNFSGLYLHSLAFVPVLPGIESMDLSYLLTCGNQTTNGTASFLIYARSAPSAYNSSNYGFQITMRNESIAYNISASSAVDSYRQNNHCTYLNFWGNPLSVSSQCGSGNAWDYRVFSGNCYTNNLGPTATYCVKPSHTGYNITFANQTDMEYRFAFDLGIQTPYGTINGTLSDRNASAVLYLGPLAVGNATVDSVYSSETPAQETLLTDGQSYSVVNAGSYGTYRQYLNSMYGTLGYYNSTEVDADIQSQIGQAISSAMAAENRMLNSTAGIRQGCEIDGPEYVCGSKVPFSYSIGVKLKRGLGIGNMTLHYLNSAVSIEGV